MTTAASFGSAELHGGGSRVIIIPALGGTIASLNLHGREWLWRSDVDPHPGPGLSNYDECFPTRAACTVPSGVRRLGGLVLPERGELWIQSPVVSVETRPDGQRATCTWEGERLPFRFMRTVQVTPTGDIRLRYTVENRGHDPLPFVWSGVPVFALTEFTRLDLPVGATVRVVERTGNDTREMAPEFQWPRARLEKKIADFTHPNAVGRHYGVHCFMTLPATPIIVALEEQESRLEMHFDGREIPHFLLSLEKKERWLTRRISGDSHVAFGPSVGAPGSLSDAMGHWHSAQWLDGGARREWSMTLKAFKGRGSPQAT